MDTINRPELLGTVYFQNLEERTGAPVQVWLGLARIITDAVVPTGRSLIFNSGGPGPDSQGCIDEVLTWPPLPPDQARAVAQLILSRQEELLAQPTFRDLDPSSLPTFTTSPMLA